MYKRQVLACAVHASTGAGAALSSAEAVLTAGGQSLMSYALAPGDLQGQQAAMLLELYRYQGRWRVGAVGQGFRGGLSTLAEYFSADAALLGGQGSGMHTPAAPPTSASPISASSSASAAAPTPPSSQEAEFAAPPAAELLALLEGHEFFRLDDLFAQAQQRFEGDQSDEYELDRMVSAFWKPDQRLGEHFTAWFEATPPAYGKLLALSHWLLALGWQARGGRTSNFVSDRGWRDLHSALEQTTEYSTQATAFSRRPLHAYMVLAAVNKTVGCQLSEEDIASEQYPEWYTEGLRAYPPSLMLRQDMLLLLRPEWGGSETMMLNYLRQQERAGFPQIQKLWAAYHAMVAHYLAHFADDPKGALERATMAAQLFPKKYNPRLFEMMDAAGRPRPERQRVLDEILLHLDDSTDLGTNFYISFMHVKDWPSHYTQQLGQHMLRQAERGDDESLLMLGRYHICLLYTSPSPRD